MSGSGPTTFLRAIGTHRVIGVSLVREQHEPRHVAAAGGEGPKKMIKKGVKENKKRKEKKVKHKKKCLKEIRKEKWASFWARFYSVGCLGWAGNKS